MSALKPTSVDPSRTFLGAYLLLLVAVPATFACTEENTDPATGSEGGACYPNATCDAGLVCLSMLCVQGPDAGVQVDSGTNLDATPSIDGGEPVDSAMELDAGEPSDYEAMIVVRAFPEVGYAPRTLFLTDFRDVEVNIRQPTFFSGLVVWIDGRRWHFALQGTMWGESRNLATDDQSYVSIERADATYGTLQPDHQRQVVLRFFDDPDPQYFRLEVQGTLHIFQDIEDRAFPIDLGARVRRPRE